MTHHNVQNIQTQHRDASHCAQYPCTASWRITLSTISMHSAMTHHTVHNIHAQRHDASHCAHCPCTVPRHITLWTIYMHSTMTHHTVHNIHAQHHVSSLCAQYPCTASWHLTLSTALLPFIFTSARLLLKQTQKKLIPNLGRETSWQVAKQRFKILCFNKQKIN
jgi:hypothetical protein